MYTIGKLLLNCKLFQGVRIGSADKEQCRRHPLTLYYYITLSYRRYLLTKKRAFSRCLRHDKYDVDVWRK